MKHKNILIILFSIVFLASFVLAAATAPTDVTFSGNTSAHYDEGVFNVNWTAGVGGDAVTNYNVYAIVAGNAVQKQSNNSVTGFNFSTVTEANYTFIVEAVNETGTGTNSTDSTYIYVDRTAPTVALPVYTNATKKRNTDTLTLNISAIDASSGVGSLVCWISIGSNANQTISGSNGWCNSTTIPLTGLSDGNNTISVYVNDTVGNSALNNSFVVWIDTTGPIITLPEYTNATKKKNTDTLTLNISVTDAGSGLTSSACKIEINGTNQTVAVSNGWCNTTSGNLTSLADGNQTINIYVNDTFNNLALSNSYVVWIDTTAPSISVSCSSKPIVLNSITTCTCTRSDSGSGFNESTLVFPTSFSTSSLGTQTVTCEGSDYAGNSASASGTYYVDRNIGGGGSGGGSVVSQWVKEIKMNGSEMNVGQTLKQLKANYRITFNVKGVGHHVGIKNMTSTTATIEVASTPQIATFSLGETKKFDVDGDNSYDVSVTLNSIVGGYADVTITPINEVMPSAQTEPVTTDDTSSASEGTADAQQGAEKKGNVWMWVLVGIVLVAVIVFGVFKLSKKKK